MTDSSQKFTSTDTHRHGGKRGGRKRKKKKKDSPIDIIVTQLAVGSLLGNLKPMRQDD
jgi:hypothetical protein